MSFPRDGIVTLPKFLTEEAVATVVSTLQLDVVRLLGRMIQIKRDIMRASLGLTPSRSLLGGFLVDLFWYFSEKRDGELPLKRSDMRV